MRRISLALALVGAVAAAGCGGGLGSSSSGSNKGVPGSTFTLTVNRPTGGTISSVDGFINCGTATALCTHDYSWGSSVVLNAVADSGLLFQGWAGDCTGGASTCTIPGGNADKYVVVKFAASLSGHPNWSSPTQHASAYMAFTTGAQGALQCTKCHGGDLHGLGIAPNCYSCHNGTTAVDVLPTTDPLATIGGGANWSPYPSGFVSGHFDPTQAPWGAHSGGWPQACQRCHTTGGYQDYVGADGTPDYLSGTFVSDVTTTAGTGLPGAYATGPMQCATCHNSATDPADAGITQIMFVSGATVTTDKATALCGQCHEARESTVSVNSTVVSDPTLTTTLDQQISAAGVGFRNPHYRGAAATMWGSAAQGWAQYPGQIYTGQNTHGVNAGSCVSCHDPHTLEVTVNSSTCGRCHFNETTGLPVASLDELAANRQFGFRDVDVDGNGVVEGLDKELAGLQATLITAIQAYAQNVVGQGVCYDPNTYPYFFKHTGTGACLSTETVSANQFKKFTARLYRATYNYKFADTDYAAWAHNPRYAIQVLFDAITDLNAGLAASGQATVPFNGVRTFEGHFGGFEPATATTTGGAAFTDWNAKATIDTACSMCHGAAQGLTNYFASLDPAGGNTTTGPTVGAPQINAFPCLTCHSPQPGDTNMKSMRAVGLIYLPPEKPDYQQVVFDPSITDSIHAGDRVCMTCHTGRESMGTVTKGGTTQPATTWTNSFTNPHYLGAFGVMMGTNAKMMWEYAGQTYAGFPAFWNGPHGSPHAQRCTACHNPQGTGHSFAIDLATTVPAGTYHGVTNTKACNGCHTGPYALAPKQTNVQRLASALYADIQAYAAAAVAASTPGATLVCYNDAAYPYWFKDTNGDGVCDPSESVFANGAKFDGHAVQAAFNYKWSQAEPGAFAHNYEYMAQILIDTINDLATNTTATLPYSATNLPFDAAFDPGNTTTQIVRP